MTRGSPRSRLTLVFAIACVGVLGLAAGCGGDDDGDGGGTEGAPRELDVMLPFQDSIVWSGYEIARAPDGIYENDYDITTETTPTEGSGQIQQLVGRKRDFSVTTVPETIVANARGDELIMISTILSDVFTIAATDESGTESLEDLDGQALGITDLGGGEVPLVRAALDSVGLEPDKDVELKVVGPGGAAAFKALDSGEVSAFAGAVNDLVPLEQEGLRFQVILPDEFTNLPDNVMTVVPELLEDEEGLQEVKDLMKGWYEGVVFGEQDPEQGLDLICELVPEDCQDPAFAQGFYDKAIEISIEEARSGGCPDYEGLETVRDSIASVDAPAARDLNMEEIFPDDICKDLVPDEDAVEAQEERSAASGEGGE